MNVYIGEPIVVSDMQGPCKEGFHVPTKDEWDTLSNLMTGLSQSTAFVEKLHIPLAGYRSYSTGAVTEQGTTARFWTSIRNNNSNSNEVDITTSGYSTQNRGTGFAYTIRPFKNTSVTPTSSWTIIYQGSGSAGIFWNQTDGIISISSNGSTWYTIADKNLGATTVWNNGDTLSEYNCGKFYQRGNNYGFPFSGSVTTSYTQVNASTYGPGNYYSSSTFILDGDWETSVNTNLRGGVSQGTSTVSQELQNAYIGEYGWKYTYDFRNKTIQNLTDDGWTFSPSGSSSVYFDSNGMYCTTSSWRPIQHDIDLSNANKVTIESNCTLVSSRNYFLGIGTAYTEGNPNGTYMYFALNTTSIGIGSTTIHTDSTKPTGGFTARIEIDFTNKTIASYIGDSQYYTQSLTDAQVTTMKSYNKLQLGTAVSQNYAVDISITIE